MLNSEKLLSWYSRTKGFKTFVQNQKILLILFVWVFFPSFISRKNIPIARPH